MNVLVYGQNEHMTTKQATEALQKILWNTCDVQMIESLDILVSGAWEKTTKGLILLSELNREDHFVEERIINWAKFIGGTVVVIGCKEEQLFASKYLGEWLSVQTKSVQYKTIEIGDQKIDCKRLNGVTFSITNSTISQVQVLGWQLGEVVGVSVGFGEQGGRVEIWGCEMDIEALEKLIHIRFGKEWGATNVIDDNWTEQIVIANEERSLDYLLHQWRTFSGVLGSQVTGHWKDGRDHFTWRTIETSSNTETAYKGYRLIAIERQNAPQMELIGFRPDLFFKAIEPSLNFGRVIVYGHCIDSTQSQLSSNQKFLDSLPTGTVSVASIQTAGRGRSHNRWITICPHSALLFSLIIRFPSSNSSITSSLPLLQYLFSLAIITTLHSLAPSALNLKIKWPNDIYAAPKHSEKYQKVGGILVNCSIQSSFSIIIGCGLNLSDPAPTYSLNQLLKTHDDDDDSPPPPLHLPLTSETVLGKTLSTFESMWNQFYLQGFAPFEQSYLDHWMHSNQIITLEAGLPDANYPTEPIKVKIIGITSDNGHLQTSLLEDDEKPVKERRIIELRPDYNRFDLFHGLISVKK